MAEWQIVKSRKQSQPVAPKAAAVEVQVVQRPVRPSAAFGDDVYYRQFVTCTMDSRGSVTYRFHKVGRARSIHDIPV
jgi:hypothetical protein